MSNILTDLKKHHHPDCYASCLALR